jgi:hypothetical protein
MTQLSGIHTDAAGKPNNTANQKSEDIFFVLRSREVADRRQRFVELRTRRAMESASSEEAVPQSMVSRPILSRKPFKIRRWRIARSVVLKKWRVSTSSFGGYIGNTVIIRKLPDNPPLQIHILENWEDYLHRLDCGRYRASSCIPQTLESPV